MCQDNNLIQSGEDAVHATGGKQQLKMEVMNTKGKSGTLKCLIPTQYILS